MEAITAEQLDRVMKTNVHAAVLAMQAALPRMEPGSTIITSSAGVQAFQPSLRLMGYATFQGRDRQLPKVLGHNLL